MNTLSESLTMVDTVVLWIASSQRSNCYVLKLQIFLWQTYEMHKLCVPGPSFQS